MLSWEECMDHLAHGTITLDGLCDEELAKYYVLLTMQIYAFQQIDADKEKDFAEDIKFRDGEKIDNKEGTYLEIARTAKMAHEYLQPLQEIIKNHPKDTTYFQQLFKNQLNDYALTNNIDWNPNPQTHHIK
jgi:hypothetical protein